MWNIVNMITGGIPEQFEFLKVFVYITGLYFTGRIIFFLIDIATATFKGFFRG